MPTAPPAVRRIRSTWDGGNTPGVICPDGKRVNIPSYTVQASDVVSIREKSQKQARIQDSLSVAEQYGFPDWVEVDTSKMEGVFKSVPARQDLPPDINEQLVVELYSK